MLPIRSSGSGRSLTVIVGLLLVAHAGFSLVIAAEETPATVADAGHRLVKSVVSAAGAPRTNSSYRTHGTLGQPATPGTRTSPDHILRSGFWAGAHLPVSGVPLKPQTILFQNHPNPFNPMTTIPFSIAEDGFVEAAVYDARGHRLRILLREIRPAGRHAVIWDGRDAAGRQAATGVYFLSLRSGSYTAVKKMLLVK